MVQSFARFLSLSDMEPIQNTERDGILNETTMTLHRRASGIGEFQTPCGHLYNVAQERLRIVDVPDVADDRETSKCGQCFEDGGGY